MGVVNIRPDGVITANAEFTTGFQAPASAPASKQAAISDVNDNTWLTTVNTGFPVTGTELYGLGNPVIPAGRFIVGVKLKTRAWLGSNAVWIARIQDSAAAESDAIGASANNGVEEYSGTQRRTKPSGGNWAQADADGLQLLLELYNFTSVALLRINDVWVEVEYTDQAAAPTGVTPSAGATVNTDVPTLTATVSASPNTNVKTKAEWQLATDNAFTANVRTITESDTDLILGSHAASESVPNASQLFQGTWYIRCRAIDEYGTQGLWSAAQQFTVSHPPTTTAHSPTGDTSLPYGAGTFTFSWTFSDTSPVDSQTALQAVIERNDTGAAVVDTGKVVSAVANRNVAVPAAQKDQPLRWKVRVWDSDDVVGAYSGYHLFRVRDLPTVVVTAPTGAVNNPSPQAVWTFAAAGRTQMAFRVVYERDDAGVFTVVHDTGWVSSSATSYSPSSSLYLNGESGRITVYVRDSSGLENSDSDTFTVAFTPPAAPTFTIDTTGYDTLGYNRIVWHGNIQTYNQASLEIDGSGWQGGTNGVFARSNTFAEDGAWSARITSSAAGDANISTLGGINARPVVPGFIYTWAGRVAAGTVSRNARYVISWFTEDGVLHSTSSGAAISVPVGSFTDIFVTAAAPPGAGRGRVILRVLATGAAGEQFYLDKIGHYLGTDTTFFNNDQSSLGWRVYRRLAGSGTAGWVLLDELPVTTMHYDDYTAGANQQYEYAVVQIADRFGVTVESVYNAVSATPAGTNYWLIVEDDPTLNVLLEQVTSEDYSDEYEEETLRIIGRGRKKDRGTRWGYAGSLTATIWDSTTVTARTRKQQLEALKRSRSTAYLRNPFGDVWQVSLGSISISRVAGVGQREFVDVTIPYEEVS